jgi:ubiquinone/menaquinone biosynthesis C-methylase UbiE
MNSKPRVEIRGFTAKHYDSLMNTITLGRYSLFIQKVISLMKIRPENKIIDLGAGTGRNACLMLEQLSIKGELVGFDISEEMIDQFNKRCSVFTNAIIIPGRIEQDLGYRTHFDKAFISFVLHGFPQNKRKNIIKNTFEALKKDGEFFILDYNEFKLKEMPFYFRIPFKLVECPYAFDFIEKDWKVILAGYGFDHFEEYFFFKGYVRLLKAKKIS